MIKRILPFCLALLLLGATLARAESSIKWIPGFPQRIGAKVMLMWEPQAGAAKYLLSRTTEGVSKPQALESVSNHLMDENIDPALNLSYQVSAVDSSGRTIAISPAAKLKGMVLLNPPTWGGYHQEGPQLLLTWQGPQATVFYNLYRVGPDGKPVLLSASSLPRYTDVKIVPGEVYEYFLRGVDVNNNESKDSEHISVKVEGWTSAPVETVAHRHVEAVPFKLAENVRLSEPTDLLIRNGQIYVTDAGSKSVMVLGSDGKLIRRFATSPTVYLGGTWGVPWGISADAYGTRFAVTFLMSTNVRLFDANGYMVVDVAVEPPKDVPSDRLLNKLPQPMDVAIEDQEGFWVSEYTYSQVLFFDVRGRELGRVGKARVDRDPGPFRGPTFLTMNNATGHVDVVDSLAKRVFSVSKEGKVEGYWGGQAKGDGALYLPKGVAVNSKGEVLVIDGILSTLQAFSQEGKLLALYEPENERDRLPKGLVSVAVNPENDDIYVLSKLNSQIYRLRLTK